MRFVTTALQRIVTPDQLFTLATCWKQDNHSIVFTCGCFDVLHQGHAFLFKQALRRGTKLVIAVNTDDYCRRHKGEGRPVQQLTVRQQVVAGVSMADAVITLEDDTPERLLACLQPDVYMLGSDHQSKWATIPGSQYCRRVEFVGRLAGYSTTAALSGAVASGNRQSTET